MHLEKHSTLQQTESPSEHAGGEVAVKPEDTAADPQSTYVSENGQAAYGRSWAQSSSHRGREPQAEVQQLWRVRSHGQQQEVPYQVLGWDPSIVSLELQSTEPGATEDPAVQGFQALYQDTTRQGGTQGNKRSFAELPSRHVSPKSKQDSNTTVRMPLTPRKTF